MLRHSTMIVWFVVLSLISGSLCQREEGLTPARRWKHNIANVAKFNDAENRGERWYAYNSQSDSTGLETVVSEDSSMYSDIDRVSTSHSSEASSAITIERRLATKTHRLCQMCPHEMLKQWGNGGIKWICGAYQRARRSFKSECMMRYRNCQDGTMFVKLSDHRCKNSTYHGRHWFYVYRVA